MKTITHAVAVSEAAAPVTVTASSLAEDAKARQRFAFKLLALTLGTFVLVVGFSTLANRVLTKGQSVATVGGPHSGMYLQVPDRISGFEVDPMVGRQLFMRSCSSCHGQAGGGMPEQGVALRGSAFVLSTPDSSLMSFVKLGRPAADTRSITGRAMPPQGGDRQLSPQDLADIVAYLRSLQVAASATASRG